MELSEELAEEIAALEAHGRLDSMTAPQLRDRLLALAQTGRSAIVVDLQSL